MPTYEYACPACGIVEVFQSIKEDALTKCPQCKRRKVTRMVSTGGAVIFKGSGFWETDYNRSKEYGAKSKADQGKAKETADAAPAAPPAEPKPEPKPQPAAKPATKLAETTPAPATSAKAKPPAGPRP